MALLSGSAPEELYRTFNMGIGFVAVVPPGAVDSALSVLREAGRPGHVIGEVVPGTGAVHLLTTG